MRIKAAAGILSGMYSQTSSQVTIIIITFHDVA
jgi:hypothetical protein